MSARDLPALARCRAILGGDADPFAHVWNSLDERERAFWLQYARQSPSLVHVAWRDFTGDVRCRIKNSLYRAAARADTLLKAGVMA